MYELTQRGSTLLHSSSPGSTSISAFNNHQPHHHHLSSLGLVLKWVRGSVPTLNQLSTTITRLVLFGPDPPISVPLAISVPLIFEQRISLARSSLKSRIASRRIVSVHNRCDTYAISNDVGQVIDIRLIVESRVRVASAGRHDHRHRFISREKFWVQRRPRGSEQRRAAGDEIRNILLEVVALATTSVSLPAQWLPPMALPTQLSAQQHIVTWRTGGDERSIQQFAKPLLRRYTQSTDRS